MRAFFHGVLGRSGHFLHTPDGQTLYNDPLERPDGKAHLDPCYAPRVGLRGKVRGVPVCWAAQGATLEERQRILYDSEEHPQGAFLRHEHAGFSFIAWWDRTQGDTRPNCNSAFLLEGTHSSDDLYLALAIHFPRVAQNLMNARVKLYEVVP